MPGASMSDLVDRSEYSEAADFILGESVSFLHGGARLYGEIVRIYNTRTVYHVEVEGRRYSVSPRDDDMRRES